VLPRRFYERPAPRVACQLLGCILVSRLGGALTAGRIVETEAYLGPEDGASHAGFRPASRWLFYGHGGIAYVFLAYGLHACLNAIAGRPGTPGCVLIRALEPLVGLEVMAIRRGRPVDPRAAAAPRATLTAGPARLTQALGITVRDSGRDLRAGPLRIHAPARPTRLELVTGRRVGITRSRDLLLRFSLRDSPYVSRPLPRGPSGGEASPRSARRRLPPGVYR
jgi:DNA-3-methyladenine glycosylase